MGSISTEKQPHAVCVPYPAQGHISPMLKLAKLLHHHGFRISFVNTEYNHRRLLRARGPTALDGIPGFSFHTISDGLPFSDADVTQDVPSLCYSTPRHCLSPFCDLIDTLNRDPSSPPVSCIVSDGVMTFTLKAAKKFGLPEVCLWTASACGLLGYAQYRPLLDRGLVPLQDMDAVTNGYLEKTLDWVPGMRDIKLKDLPSFLRTTDRDDIMLNFVLTEVESSLKAPAIIINTFDSLEKEALEALSAYNSRIYTIGPIQNLLDTVEDETLKSLGSNLWVEEPGCIEWLDGREPDSVVYVNFGSITTMTAQQLVEFAWGLANSRKPFLWIVRPDLVSGETAVVPPEFMEETKGRRMMASWCPQDEVLKHPAVGGFLTHSGWNSTLESIIGGVPVICWPFFAEQMTNSRYSRVEWGMGMEIDNDVKREEVEGMVREMMDGDGKGKEMRMKARRWKELADESCIPGGSSYVNFHKVLNDFLLPQH